MAENAKQPDKHQSKRHISDVHSTHSHIGKHIADSTMTLKISQKL